MGATVSIGVATSFRTVTDLDALIIRADAALYSAKHGGRNRFHVADDEPGAEAARRRLAERDGAAGLGLIGRKLAARRARRQTAVVAAEA
jgi:predicted signal transduction protein with EAL and GGDEF domain